jgi:hypothetical protein
VLSSQVKTTPYSLLSVWVMTARYQATIVSEGVVAIAHPIACENCAPKILARTTWPPRPR